MAQFDVKREARFRAGLILESVVAAGWSGEPQNEQHYGEETAEAIAAEIGAIASRLIKQGS